MHRIIKFFAQINGVISRRTKMFTILVPVGKEQTKFWRKSESEFSSACGRSGQNCQVYQIHYKNEIRRIQKEVQIAHNDCR